MVELTSEEEKVMKIIWHLQKQGIEAGSMAQVQAELKSRFDLDLARQTVSTFLQHLVAKEYLTTEKRGRTVYYKSIISLETYRQYKLDSFVGLWFSGDKKACAKYIKDMVTHSESASENLKTKTISDRNDPADKSEESPIYNIEVVSDEYNALKDGLKNFILINRVVCPVSVGDIICIRNNGNQILKKISYTEKASNGLKRGFCIAQLSDAD